MKIFIISNYYKINKNIFNLIKNEDIVVFMNNAYHDNKFFDEKKKLLFIRKKKTDEYWGYKENYNNRYNKIYFIDGNETNIYYKYNKDNCEKIFLPNNISRFNIEYTINKEPTTGFIAYLHLKNEYPQADICLIGFTGESSNLSGHVWEFHDYKFEQNYYKVNNIKLLNDINLLSNVNKSNTNILLLKYKCYNKSK